MPANGSQGGASGVLLHSACTQPYSWQMQALYAMRRFLFVKNLHSRFSLRHAWEAGGSPLFSSPFPCFKDLPAPCVPKCSRHPSASSDAEHHPCFVTSGAAHNNRSTAGTPSALHQQHLTPAQQATQAAITAPATHQDGKVPVRTGLAWAALGTPYPPASLACWR